jgi:hypothetical protein
MEIRTCSCRHPNFARDLVREPLTTEELAEPLCVECGRLISKNHLVARRKDTQTCSDRCRKRKERRGKGKLVCESLKTKHIEWDKSTFKGIVLPRPVQ